MPTPEEPARGNIDAQLTACGWSIGEVAFAVEVGLVRTGRLRRSVLLSAFEGRL